jgi:hypothetical protein
MLAECWACTGGYGTRHHLHASMSAHGCTGSTPAWGAMRQPKLFFMKDPTHNKWLLATSVANCKVPVPRADAWAPIMMIMGHHAQHGPS